MSMYVQTRVTLRMDVQTEIYILGHINNMYICICWIYGYTLIMSMYICINIYKKASR